MLVINNEVEANVAEYAVMNGQSFNSAMVIAKNGFYYDMIEVLSLKKTQLFFNEIDYKTPESLAAIFNDALNQ